MIPHHKGMAGHSDADVLIHAIIDALLGAAGLPDIGSQFPDSNPRYKGIDSGILLRDTLEKVRGQKALKLEMWMPLFRCKVLKLPPTSPKWCISYPI